MKILNILCKISLSLFLDLEITLTFGNANTFGIHTKLDRFCPIWNYLHWNYLHWNYLQLGFFFGFWGMVFVFWKFYSVFKFFGVFLFLTLVHSSSSSPSSPSSKLRPSRTSRSSSATSSLFSYSCTTFRAGALFRTAGVFFTATDVLYGDGGASRHACILWTGVFLTAGLLFTATDVLYGNGGASRHAFILWTGVLLTAGLFLMAENRAVGVLWTAARGGQGASALWGQLGSSH